MNDNELTYWSDNDLKRKVNMLRQLRQNVTSDTSYKAVFLDRWINDLDRQIAKRF